eukprot:scaffold74044_cov32-Tisochrysis_lutea.AAC.1
MTDLCGATEADPRTRHRYATWWTKAAEAGGGHWRKNTCTLSSSVQKHGEEVCHLCWITQPKLGGGLPPERSLGTHDNGDATVATELRKSVLVGDIIADVNRKGRFVACVRAARESKHLAHALDEPAHCLALVPVDLRSHLDHVDAGVAAKEGLLLEECVDHRVDAGQVRRRHVAGVHARDKFVVLELYAFNRL